MLVKNLTSKKQKIEVREIVGDHRVFDIFLEPDSTAELDKSLVIVNPERYESIFKIGDQEIITPVVKDTPIVHEEPVAVSTPVEAETIVEEHLHEDAPESFVCDICGAEYASARGLASHKNRSHAG